MGYNNAITKLQTILIIDLLVVAFAASGYFYVSSLPGAPLSTEQVQLSDLLIDPPSVLNNQAVTISINVTNISAEKGVHALNLTLDGKASQSIPVTLAAGETKAVNFTISEENEGTHIVSLGNIEGTFLVINQFALTDLAINRTQAKIGEPIGISVNIENRAAEIGNYSFTLSVNSSVVQTKTGQLDGSASANLLFELIEENEGNYEFTIGSLNGSFIINPSAPPPKPAEFNISDLTIDPEVAAPGMTVNITARMTNIGELTGDFSVDLLVDGETKDQKTGSLSGGETETLVFSLVETVKANYTISIGNATAILSVQEPSTVRILSVFVKPYEVWADQTVTITVRGTNSGSEASALPLKLKVDGVAAESKILQLGPNQEGTIEFTYIAPALQAGDSLVHVAEVNGMKGYFNVVKTGFHSFNVQMAPRSQVEFTITYPNGTSEKHTTYWSALLPEGSYTVVFPIADPTGKYPFVNWDDGSTSTSRTVTLTKTTTITATYEGGSSCPSLYMWNGTSYVYVTEVSNHGWLGYINCINEDGSLTYYRNNPWDYIPLDNTQLQVTNGNFNLTLLQKWNEIFYLDQAYMMVVDHPADVNVYSTMVEQYLDPNFMGKIYTVNNNLHSPVSAINEKGESILSKISKADDVFTNGTNGIQSTAWDNITWNRLTLDLGNLSGSKQIKLVVRAIVDWGSADDYTVWLDKFFAQPVPHGTQITPPPYMEVKAANGEWVRVPQSRDFALPPDGAPRTYIIDLTGLFPTNDYSLRINNFWNVTFDYVAIDTSLQQNMTVQKIQPQAYLYKAYDAGTAAATGNFTKYGNVTQLLLTEDDMFVIGRQGEAVSLQFPVANLKAPAPGMVRDYLLYEASWFKDETGNWGFGFGFTVDPLPFIKMSGFPYLANESYPNDAAHQNYLAQWNTRAIEPTETAQSFALIEGGFPIFALPMMVLAVVLIIANVKLGALEFVISKVKRRV